MSHNDLGQQLARVGKRPEAEVEYLAARKVAEALAAEFPKIREYRENLSRSHTNLGKVLASMGKRTEAEMEVRASLKLQEALAAEFPKDPNLRLGLATTHHNVGALLMQRAGDPMRRWRTARS